MSDPAESKSLKHSPLADQHARLEARMAPFAGWEMPIQYSGIVAEHRAVRESVGIFDISHMGQVRVSGDGAAGWLNGLLTNDLDALGVGQGQYTLMLNEAGGVVDDLIVYRDGDTRFFLVVNASKAEEDLDWLRSHAGEGVAIDDGSDAFGGIAVQGPGAVAAWEKVRGERGDLPPRNGIARFDSDGGPLILCRTGYTGEDGFELFAPCERIGDWFRAFLEAGSEPCGLGARDTLRLEKCYPLNGSDLDERHTPLEASLGFFVKLDKAVPFTGQAVLAQQNEDGLSERLAAIRQTQKGPPIRPGYAVFEPGSDTAAGRLSSGGLSPTLGCGIGMAYLPIALAKVGTPLEIEVRGRRFTAEVAKKPFV